MNNIEKIDIKLLQKQWGFLRERVNSTLKKNNKVKK